MGHHYNHLSHQERTLIFYWIKDKVSIREMARRLRRSHTTVSRELRRNQWPSSYGYIPRGAQIMYQWKLEQRAKRYRLKHPFIRKYVGEKLRIGWTPELISGRLKQTNPDHYICHESIYQYIYIQAPELIKYLPRKHAKRRIKRPYRTKKYRISDRVSIDQRPIEADTRTHCGHWESDTIVSSDRQSGLNVIVERKTRLTHISFMENKTAQLTHHALVKRLKHHPSAFKKSITYDNGSENTQHKKTNAKLNLASYFCAPYHSWEKGSVEQINGLIRRFFPKGTCFRLLSHAEINQVEKLLNNRPRKCLGFRTPYEVFRDEVGALAG
ncbi:MAG: IS30 family transposase [Gammaproteobacteria bacterium]|nr:IS30 family transposase [Gammaproteobacteria bacterium]